MTKKQQLRNNMKRAIILIIDERSMISSELLGACERNMREIIYQGICEDHYFGGIPVVLLVGDDYQLPPVIIKGRGKGAFHIFDQKQNFAFTSHTLLDEARGAKLFQILASNVMELNIRTRQKDDLKMINMLDEIEKGNSSDDTVDLLLKLKLSHLSTNKQVEVKKIATYIFATKDEKYT